MRKWKRGTAFLLALVMLSGNMTVSFAVEGSEIQQPEESLQEENQDETVGEEAPGDQQPQAPEGSGPEEAETELPPSEPSESGNPEADPGNGDTAADPENQELPDPGEEKPETESIAAPSNVRVTGNYAGEVELAWDAVPGAYGYAVYASDAREGLYECIGKLDVSGQELPEIHWSHFIELEEGEVNPIFYYRVCSLGQDLAEGGEFSETATNEGIICVDASGLAMMASLYSADSKSVKKLQLHVGEAVRLFFDFGLQMTVQTGEGEESQDLSQGAEYDWSVVYSDGNGNLLEDTAYETVNFWLNQISDTSDVYVEGVNVTGDKSYFLRCQFNQNGVNAEKFYSFELLIPIAVDEKEEGASYPDMGDKLPTDVFQERQKMNEYLLECLHKREEKVSVCILTSTFDSWTENPWFLDEDIFMRSSGTLPDEPWAGDYLYQCMETSDYTVTNPITYKGKQYTALQFNFSYRDDAVVEKQIEAEIAGLLSPSGKLHAYLDSSRDVKAKTCLDYIRSRGNGESAKLFYRLMMELGVPTRIVAHPDGRLFNLVEIDDEYYCVDVGRNQFLKGSDSYDIGEEAAFKELNPHTAHLVIARDDYVPKYVQLYRETESGNELVERLVDFKTAKTRLAELGTGHYIVELTGDLAIGPQDLELELAEGSICEVHMNRHILTVSGTTRINASLSNGTVKTGGNSTLVLASEGTVQVDGVKLQFVESSYTGGLSLQAAEGCSLELVNTTSNRICNMEIGGNVSCDMDMTIGGTLKLEDSSKARLGGTMTVSGISQLKGLLDVERLTVSGATTATAGAGLLVRESLALGNVTVQPLAGDPDEALHIQKVQDAKVQFNGSLTRGNASMNQVVIFEQRSIDVDGNVQESVFAEDEILATVKNNENYIPTRYFDVGRGNGAELCVVREKNELRTSGIHVLVSYISGNAPVEKRYASFTEAMKYLSSDFGSRSGEYIFEFCGDTRLTANVALPYFVQTAQFCTGAEEKHVLDFNGYTLSSSYRVRLSGTDCFKNAKLNVGTLEIESKDWEFEQVSVTTVENHGGITADTWTQGSRGKTYLYEASVLWIRKTAVIYNVMLEGSASLYQTEGSAVAFQGTFARNGGAVLSCGLYNETETQIDIAPRTKLFTTGIRTFPTDYLAVIQQGQYEKYTCVYQNGQEIRVGSEWITVKSQGASGKEEILRKFVRWTDVQNYLNTLANTSMGYVVELSEDVIVEENLVLPSRIKSITFRGLADGEGKDRVKFSFVGNLSLVTDTAFEDLELETTSYNRSTGAYESYPGTVSANGKNLTFSNTTAYFNSITGRVGTTLKIDKDSDIQTTNAVSGFGILEIQNAKLSLGGSLSVGQTLIMEHAGLSAKGRIDLVNVISNSGDNRITYGGNTSSNILTITGTVSSEKMPGEALIAVAGTEQSATVRKSAIDISVQSLEPDGYVQSAVLLNAAKAASSWFVVGSKYDGNGIRTSCAYTTHKAGTVIRCGNVQDEAVILEAYDTQVNSYVANGGFQTLQAAFDEITRLNDKSAKYRVVIVKDDKNVVTKTNVNLATPSMASELTIEGGTIFYSSSVSLKCNTEFRNVTFAPESGSGSFSVGTYSLGLNGCSVADGKKLASISGSGVSGASSLAVKGNSLILDGSLSNIASLCLDGASLTVNGNIQIGDLHALSEKVTLTGYASVQRSQGKITQVAPYITVSGQIYGDDRVALALREQTGSGWRYIDFDSDEAENIRNSGIRLASAPNVSSQAIQASPANLKDIQGYIVKESGYLTYRKTAPGIVLSYKDAQGQDVKSMMADLAAAAAEINNLRVKRDYTLTLLEELSHITKDAPKALTMPNASYVSSLIIQGEGDAPVDLYFTGNIANSSDWDISNVHFVQMVLNDGKYVPAEEYYSDYPPILSWSVNGYRLTVGGTVIFNTPLNLQGSGRSTLAFRNGGQLYTETNGRHYDDTSKESLICGSLNGFADVTLKDGQELRLCEYGSSASRAGGSASITNVTLHDAKMHVEGSGAFTNVTLSRYAELFVEKEFNISGTLTSTTSEGYLFTRQRGAGQAPYLQVSGKVMLQDADEDRLHVGVYPARTASRPDIPVRLQNAPKADGQLLTARLADVDKFLAWEDNVGNVGLYGPENQDGYILKKNGSAIYVYTADEISVALCEGDASSGDLGKARVLNYYSSFQEAVSAVDARRDRTKAYTLMLLQDNGSMEKPISLTLPSYAARVIVASQRAADPEASKKIYFNNNLKLNADTVFENVELAPVNRLKKGAALGISTGSYDLALNQVTVGDAEGMALSNISGSSNQTTTLNSPELAISGNVTNSRSVIVRSDAIVKGSFSTADLVLVGGVTLQVDGAVTLTDIDDRGEAENRLVYGRNASNYTNLTINGTVSGENEHLLVLDMISKNGNAEEYLLNLNAAGTGTALSELKKLANMAKASTSMFDWRIDGTPTAERNQIVKANRGVYLADEEAGAYHVRLKYGSTYSDCLDYSQAVTEMNTLADASNEYVVLFENLEDTCITDASRTATLSMPNSRYVRSLTLQSNSKKEMKFMGGLSYSGNLTLMDCDLSIQNGISQVKALTLEDTSLITGGSSSLQDLYLVGASSWDALGNTTLTNIWSEQSTGGYIASVQDYRQNPLFTVNGTVSDPVSWQVLIYGSPTDARDYIVDYQNVKLVKAVKESADKFRTGAWSEDTIAYKDAYGYVYNGNKAEMAVQIQNKDTSSLTYARSFYEAVQVINNLGDKTASYEMQLLQPGYVKTAANESYGALTLPTNAAKVTIKGGAEETILAYTGTLRANCDTAFENLVLTEGRASGQTFTPSYMITPEFYSNFQVSLASNVKTLKAEGDVQENKLVFSRITGRYGGLELENTDVLVQGAITLPQLGITGDVLLEGKQALTLTNLTGSGNLRLVTYFQASSQTVTQLAVNGSIDQVKLTIAPQIYDTASRSWHPMAREEIEKFDIQTGINPTYYQRIAALPKAAIENIDVVYGSSGEQMEGLRVYKQDGNLYLTTQEPALRLIGYQDSLNGKKIYESEFLNWNQSIQEINRIADRSNAYELILLRDIGIVDGTVIPVGTLSMPNYAKELRIKPDAIGEMRQIFFTGASISLGCGTWFENIGLMAVRSYRDVQGRTKYQSKAYNISAGGYVLTECMMAESCEDREGQSYSSMPSAVTGSAAGAFRYAAAAEAETPAERISGFGTVDFTIMKDQAQESRLTVKSGISGVTHLDLYDGISVECLNGDVSVTNMSLTNAKLWAKNITNSTMAALDGSLVKAGTNVVGDGRCSLNQITIKGTGNTLEAKQDSNGNSMLAVNGRVDGESEPIFVGLCYNNSESDYVQLYEGMTLLAAPQEAASKFRPLYASGVQTGMGEEREGFGTYKYGRNVLYGNLEAMEARLYFGETESYSHFASFEEAVSEINYLNRYDQTLRKYDDYKIELLKDVEIGNQNGNGSYSALPMPRQAGTVTIYSNGDKAALRFGGGLSISCNTVLKNIALYPMRNVQGKGEPVQADYNLGSYQLTFEDVKTTDEKGNSLVRNVTGSTAAGTLCLKGGTELTVNGNFSSYKVLFEAGESERTVLRVNGTIYTVLTEQTGPGESIIQKPLNTAFTLYGTQLDVDGDGVKKNVSVIRGDNAPELCVQFTTDTCPAGTTILTCRYLDKNDYVIRDQLGREYGCYANGTSLMLGDLVADRDLVGFEPLVQYALSSYSFVYTGQEIRPVVFLKDGSQELEENVHYRLEYGGNVNAGMASIQVTGIEENGYSGEGSISYRIDSKNLAANDVNVSFTGAFKPSEDGETLLPVIEVRDGGRPEEDRLLIENKDYQCIYKTNVDGKTELSLTGIGNYRGYVTKAFESLERKDLFKIASCSLVKDGFSNTESTTAVLQMSVDSGIPEELKDRLYVVEMNGAGDEIEAFAGKAVLESGVGSSAVLHAEIDSRSVSEEGVQFRENMMQRYGLAAVTEDGYRIVSRNARYIENPEVKAVTTKSYQGYYEGKITSKKGMQGVHANATADLNMQATLLNVNLNELIKSSQNLRKYSSESYVSYEYKGQTYYFLDMVAYQNTIYALNGWDNKYGGQRMNVSLNLLLAWDSELSYLIHPQARSAGRSYYTLNMKEEKARETFEALFCYMGEKLGGSKVGSRSGYKYRVSNWVLGNEVNCCQAWNYSGNLSLEDCVENYAEAFQLLYQGVKQWDKNTRVFISLDHSWNVGGHGHSGRDFLDHFAEYMYETAPEMRWNVDYHPYSQPLSRNDFWNDFSNTTDEITTPYISMRNLDVLTDYLEELENGYFPGKESEAGGDYIRVILGEQGYTTEGGVKAQAAATGYGFYIATFNTRVDAYVNRAYNDDPRDGISLGIMNRRDEKKESYDVYKDMDTAKSLDVMDPYLSTVQCEITKGATSWADIYPELRNMPDGDGRF